MKILVVSTNYPSNQYPTHGVFVYNLIQKFVALGHEVNVITTQNILRPYTGNVKEAQYGPERATVFYPNSISVSNKWIFGFNTYLIGEKFNVHSIRRTVRKNNLKFDVVYAHFMPSGIIAVKALRKWGKPIFVAEGEFRNINIRKAYYKPKNYQKFISNIKGFIAVSPQIKENLVDVGANADKIIIKPNAVDVGKFYPRNKIEMRKKFSFPLDRKLAIFVGRFVHDKGPLRVLKAVENIDNVSVVFVGKGDQELNSDRIVFNEKVNSALIPELLSAADVFVLPTLHEGSCNAIIEAMACGLPVVSSDIPEIRFQCDSESSILVNPMDVDKIEWAIRKITSDEALCETMGKQALQYSKNFEITKRAADILNFIKENTHAQIT